MDLEISKKVQKWLICNLSNKPFLLVTQECCKKFKLTKRQVTCELTRLKKQSPKELTNLKNFDDQLFYILMNLTDTQVIFDSEMRDTLGYSEKVWRKLRLDYINIYVVKLKNKYVWGKRFLIQTLIKRFNNN